MKKRAKHTLKNCPERLSNTLNLSHQPRLTNVMDEPFVLRQNMCKILHDLGFLKISETVYEAISYIKDLPGPHPVAFIFLP